MTQTVVTFDQKFGDSLTKSLLSALPNLQKHSPTSLKLLTDYSLRTIALDSTFLFMHGAINPNTQLKEALFFQYRRFHLAILLRRMLFMIEVRKSFGSGHPICMK